MTADEDLPTAGAIEQLALQPTEQLRVRAGATPPIAEYYQTGDG